MNDTFDNFCVRFSSFLIYFMSGLIATLVGVVFYSLWEALNHG